MHYVTYSVNEGLLLGQVVSHITEHISDSQLNNVKEETVTYVHGHIPCQGTFSWYDSKGQVIHNKIRQLLPKDGHREVIGWYRCRRHSSLTVSLREREIHKRLKEYFSKVASQNFLLVLFTSSENQKMSTHSFDHLIMSYNDRQFQKLSLQISNLKETSHGEYKLQGNPVASPNSSGFNKAFSAYQNEFYEKSGELRDVANIRHLNSTMHKQLRDMGHTIMGQEHELQHLTSEVQALQDRLNSKLALKAQSNTGPPQMMSSVPEDVPKKSDEIKVDQPTKPEAKKPNYANPAKKQMSQAGKGLKGAANHQRTAAASGGSAAAPSNGPGGIRDDLKDLFTHSPSSSVEEEKDDTEASKEMKKPVGEGEEDMTPLLQPIQLHSSKINAKTSDSKNNSKDPKRPTDVGKSSENSRKLCNEEKDQGSKDAFGFIAEIIKLESPVEREGKGIKGKVPVGGKKSATEDNNKTSKTKGKTTSTTCAGKRDAPSKDAGCHIRELSASPSRAMARERLDSSPSRTLKNHGRSSPITSQMRGARSRSGSRGRGVRQSSSPTF